MLRAITRPDGILHETVYVHIDESNLWQNGGGYGECGHFVWRTLAQLAELTNDRVVAANANFLVREAEGRRTENRIKAVLRKMHADGLAPIVDQKGSYARRLIAPLTPVELRSLERAIGVFGKRQSNLRQALRSTDDCGDWLYELLSLEQKVEAWGGR